MKVPQISLMVFLFAIPNTLLAQEQRSWSELNHLRAGQRIVVIENNMKRHDGKFIGATDELLSINEQSTDVSIKRNDVARVSASSAAKRGEHVLIGLLVGGAGGAAIGALSGSSHGFLGGSSRGLTTLAGVVIGAPTGVIVGAVVPAHSTVYRASPGSPRQTAQR
jgi:hypothetical protein